MGLGYCGMKRGDRSKASIEAISQIKSTSPPALCAILRLGNGSGHGNKRVLKVSEYRKAVGSPLTVLGIEPHPPPNSR